MGLRCRDRIARDVKNDAPLDATIVVLRADDGDSDGVRPSVMGRVLDCPAVPVKEASALLPGSNPCCVFGFAGHGRDSSPAPWRERIPSQMGRSWGIALLRGDDSPCGASIYAPTPRPYASRSIDDALAGPPRHGGIFAFLIPKRRSRRC